MNDRHKHLYGREDINQKDYYQQTTLSEERVLSMLKAAPQVDIQDIKVFVHDNEIHLQGFVQNIKEKTMVESLIQNSFEQDLVSHLQVRSDENEVNTPH